MMTTWRGHARRVRASSISGTLQVDGSRRIIRAIRAVLERPEC
jgi:hypothetical protein